jgi:hypothetical protein
MTSPITPHTSQSFSARERSVHSPREVCREVATLGGGNGADGDLSTHAHPAYSYSRHVLQECPSGLLRTSGLDRDGFFYHLDGTCCEANAQAVVSPRRFSERDMLHFRGRCGGRSAVGGGNGTHRIQLRARTRGETAAQVFVRP